MLNLIVKGDKFQSARAAGDRNIPLVFIREVRRGSAVETIARTGDQHRDAVVAWFGEEPRNAPFPVGALLLFS
jgi:hypothetical protein